MLSFGFSNGHSGLVRLFFSFLEDYECEFRQNNYEIITKENYEEFNFCFTKFQKVINLNDLDLDLDLK